jgi:alpha-glucoside transport system substrate-binding protein
LQAGERPADSSEPTNNQMKMNQMRGKDPMRKRWLRLAAVPLVFAFVAAACGDDDDDDAAEDTGVEETTAPDEGTTPDDGTAAEDMDLAGTTVTLSGVESSEEEAGAMQAALDGFAEANGMTITYVGSRDFEEQIGTQVSGGNPPDIGFFPQPGTVVGFGTSGDAVALPDDVVAAAQENWSESWLSYTNVDGVQYGMPTKSDLKSLVWYVPSVWEENGYEVPETLDDFFALTDEMIANGDTPLCVGIESGPATGWPFTDWVEELVLRNEGADYYNQWLAHEVPFNDPPVVEAITQVADLWATEGAVFAPGGSIVSTFFGDNGPALVEGNCMMHRQANFFAAFMPEGTEFGDGPGQVSTFYFPANEGSPILVGGLNAAVFRDAPEVWAVMKYIASSDFADARQGAQAELVGGISGYMTANQGADPSLDTPCSTRRTPSRPLSDRVASSPVRRPRSSTARPIRSRQPTRSRRRGRADQLRFAM